MSELLTHAVSPPSHANLVLSVQWLLHPSTAHLAQALSMLVQQPELVGPEFPDVILWLPVIVSSEKKSS
jgi:hypothetical protein